MKYSELKSSLEELIDIQLNTSVFEDEHIPENLIDSFIRNINKDLEKEALENLFFDIIKSEIDYYFRNVIGDDYYIISNNFAFLCLKKARRCRALWDYREVPDWTQNALKCFDNLLLFYSNNYFKDSIQKNNPHYDNSERDVYNHFVRKGGDYKIIGDSFNIIYRRRNRFTHIQKNVDGKRVSVEINNKNKKKIYNQIINEFQKALTILLKYYKLHFDNQNIVRSNPQKV